MGYTTEFDGEVTFDRPLKKGLVELFRELRDGDWRDDPDKPGAFCQWELDDDNQTLRWDYGEKFYDYVEWLKYLIGKAAEKGYVANGEFRYQGEEIGDTGRILVVDNRISVREATF